MTRPPLARYVLTETMWWLGWFIVSFLIGWDITDQLTSLWFWLIAAALIGYSVHRWRSFETPPLTPSQPSSTPVSRVQRSLLAFVVVMFVVLVVASLSADDDVGEGRTVLLTEEVDSGAFATWSEGVAAADAELLGLTVYDYALLVGVVFIAVEFVALFVGRRRDRKLWILDTLASLSTQIPFYLVEIFAFLAMIATYFVLWDHVALWHLPVNGWTIVAGIIAADLAYYWEHRTTHEIRLLWTGHAVHHSSPIFNTAVAFRFGPLEPVVAILFHLPLIMLGFHPAIVILGELSVQAYQFWIHTDVIGRLGPLDRVLNTPSNHRVHHGSDQKYLDRNHGGILMVWDQLFGTYQAEEETPVYGLTTQIDTVNPLKVWFSEFPLLFRDLRAAPTWRVWFGHLFNPPGWRP